MKQYTRTDLQHLYGDVPSVLYDRINQSLSFLSDLSREQMSVENTHSRERNHLRTSQRRQNYYLAFLIALFSVIFLLIGISLMKKDSMIQSWLQPMDVIANHPTTQSTSLKESHDSFYANSDEINNLFQYTILEDETIEITRFLNNSSEKVLIPKAIDGHYVTKIGEGAFYQCYSIRSVSIPEGVIHIGTKAFSNCTSLNTIIIPDTVETIGTNAFEYCISLKSIQIPDSVKSVGIGCFYYCYSLDSIILSQSLTLLSDDLFSYCRSLETIVIPKAITSVGDNTFAFCESLVNINLPEGLISIGNYAFGSCTKLCMITIPKSVKNIARYSFLDSNNLTIFATPDSYAAEYCNENCLRFHPLPNID